MMIDQAHMTTTNHNLNPELPQTWTWRLHGSGMAADDHHHHYCYYGHQQQQQHNHRKGLLPGEEMQHHRELLFEKPLTPSDVGKLNRLVIPKQHAERHFPIDGESGEKGLLLSFEDESGKPWRFRYSYWTSSQSYVLTKGWSRFVKEKRLDAGDVVLFERRRSDADRLYIRWKRRGDVGSTTASGGHGNNTNPHAAPWNPVQFVDTPRVYYCPQNPSALYELPNDAVRFDREIGSPDKVASMPAASSSWTATSTNSKRLRLFGVNLDCGGFGGAESTDAMAPHGTTDEFRHRVVELQLLPCNGIPSSQLL